MRRLRDFPSIAAWETAALFNRHLATDAAGDDGLFDEASIAVFGVTRDDVSDEIAGIDDPESEDDEAAWAEEFYDESGQVAMFARHGWDVTDEHGAEMLVLGHFAWQLLAAIKGELGASLPDRETLSADAWERQLTQKVISPRRSSAATAKTAPLTDEERWRRNAEAKSSNVWRPPRPSR